MSHILETDRLLLLPLQDEDIDPLYEIQRNPESMQYTFCAKTREDTKTRLHAYADQLEQFGFAPWTARLKSNQKIIGWGGLNVDPVEPGWGIEVAYFFHSDYWGKGLATELVRASIEHGFTNLKLEAINAYTHKDNIASTRVLEKCGFTFLRYEPKLDRNHFKVHGKKVGKG